KLARTSLSPKRAKRFQIRRPNSPERVGAVRILPLDHGFIPCLLQSARPAIFPPRLRSIISRLWMVTAAIAFVLLAQPGSFDWLAQAWLIRRHAEARASERRVRGALVTAWCGRSISTSITSSLPTVTVM